MTFRLHTGELVTSKDGEWPTQYTNRTQAQRAADKIPGAEMIQRGRPFYVRVPEPTSTPMGFPVHRCSHNVMIPHANGADPAYAWKCGDCGYIYGWHDRHPRGTEPPTPRTIHPADYLAVADLDASTPPLVTAALGVDPDVFGPDDLDADAGTHDDAEPGRSND